MQRPDDFVRALLSSAMRSGQQAPTNPFPNVAPPMPMQKPAPVPQPQTTPPPNPVMQQVARQAVQQLLSPAQFASQQAPDFNGIAALLGGARPPTMGIQEQKTDDDYTGDWVVVDVGPRGAGTTPVIPGTESQTLIFMPAANAADVPPDAIITTISNDPTKIQAAQERGQLLSQQDDSTQIYFQTKEQRDDNLYEKKREQLLNQQNSGTPPAPLVSGPAELAAIQSQPNPAANPVTKPANALGQTPDQVMAGSQDFEQLQSDLRTKPRDVVLREQAEKTGTDTPEGYGINVLRTSDLRDQGMTGQANTLENNGIFEVSTGEMVIRDGEGNVRKVPYTGEDQKLPDDWTVIVYGGKEEAPSNIRDEKRGGIRIPIVSDLFGVEIPAGALPNGVVDVLNMPAGAASTAMELLSKPQQIVVTGYGTAMAEYYLNGGEIPDWLLTATSSVPGQNVGLGAFTSWIDENKDTATGVYENGYTDPKTGEKFTGGRAVWERFQADRNTLQRGADVVLTDPLTFATGGAGEGVETVGKAASKVPVLGKVAGPVLEEGGRFIDDVGKEINAGAGALVDRAKTGAGKVIKLNEGSRAEVGTATAGDLGGPQPSNSGVFRQDALDVKGGKSADAGRVGSDIGRTGQRETRTVLDDVLGGSRRERRDIGTELPVAEPDVTKAGSRNVDLGNGNVARASMGENPTWTVYDRDGKIIVDRGTWNDVTKSEPYQTELRARGVDPRDVGVGPDEAARDLPEQVDPGVVETPRERVTAGPDDVLPNPDPSVRPQVETPPLSAMPEPSIGEDMVEIVPDKVYAERDGPVWNVVNQDGAPLANGVTWDHINENFVPEDLKMGTAERTTPSGQQALPDLAVGGDRTANNLTPDAMPLAETPVQRRIREQMSQLDYLRPQTAEERAVKGRAMRPTDRAVELASDYPYEAQSFVNEYVPKAEQAFQRNVERRGRGNWISGRDGFKVKKAVNQVEDAEHYVDDILPTWNRHFGDVEPAPDYAWQRKPEKTESAFKRNLKNQDPEQLMERYIFDEREQHATAARTVLEDKYIFRKDEAGQRMYGENGKPLYKDANGELLDRTLQRADRVRERYIDSRIQSDALAPADGAKKPPVVEDASPEPRQGMTQGQSGVLQGNGRRQPQRPPRRLSAVEETFPNRPEAPTPIKTPSSIPGRDRGALPANNLTDAEGRYTWNNATVGESQARVLRQKFSDGEMLGDRFNRYVDEIKRENPKQQQARIDKASEQTRTIASDTRRPQTKPSLFGEVDAVDGTKRLSQGEVESIAKEKVLAEWAYENMTDKGKARADEWYAKYRKTMSEESAREAAVRRALSSEANNKLLRAYDRAGRALRGTILYNALSAPRTIIQQSIGNATLAALAKEKGMLEEVLTPASVRDSFKKVRAEGGDDLITEMDRARESWGLSGKREDISGTISTRDQAGSSIEDMANRRQREARTKLGWRDFNIFNSRAVRDMAGAQDLAAREALWTTYMDYSTAASKQELRARMESRLPSGITKEEFNSRFDDLPSRFSADDIRDRFEDVSPNWADRGARDWQENLYKADRAASEEVKRLLFDGTMTNADDIARRFVFFHYWMSRAMPMYTAMIARDPVYLLNYTRMVEAMEKENDSKSYVDKGFLSWMKTPFGYNIAIRPDVFFPTFKDAWDNAGYAPDGENFLGKLFREVGFMPHPVIGTALNMLGMMGDTYAPDPTGTGRLRRLATESVDFYKSVTGEGGTDPTRDPTNDLLLRGRAWITDKLDFVPGIDEIPYRDSMVYTEREIDNIAIDIAKERGIDTESDEFTAALEDPNSDIRREAFNRWSNQNAIDVGLSVSPMGVFYPKSTLISPKERGEAAAQARATREGTSYGSALPVEQQLYDEMDIANTQDPQARALKQQQNEYQGLGTERQRAGIAYYNGIRYGYTEEVINAGGYSWTPQQIAGMSEEERTVLADLWAEEAGYADDIETIREERKTYRDANPDYADYVTWSGSVRDFEGGPTRYWEKTAPVNPNAGRWYADNPDEAGLTSVDAYLAYKGVNSDYRQPEPISVRNSDAIPADATDLIPGDASKGSGSTSTAPAKEKTSGPTKEYIQKGIAEYTERKKTYLDTIEQIWGQRVDPDMMDPVTRGNVEKILKENYGLEPPYVSGYTKEYLQWAAAQTGPSGIDDYLSWYETSQPSTPTGEDIQGVSPDDAQYILAGS